MSSFDLDVYVLVTGEFFGASCTDQAGSRSHENRTHHGEPCVYVGTWSPSQFPWMPFKRALKKGIEELEGKL